MLKFRLQRSDLGRRPELAAQIQPKDAELWQLKMYLEEVWAHQTGNLPLLGGKKEKGVTAVRTSFPMSAPRQEVTMYRSRHK